MMKSKLLLLLFCLGMLGFQSEASVFLKKKEKEKKKSKTEKVESKKKTAYDEFMASEGRKEAKGVMNLHSVKGKLYLEMPMALLGREMLLGSTISKISNNGEALVGLKVEDPMLIIFELGDSTTQVLMKKVAIEKVAGASDVNIAKSIEVSNIPAIIDRFVLKTFNNDTTTVIFDVTPLFAQEKKYLGGLDPYGSNAYGGVATRMDKFQSNLSYVTGFKAYDDNVVIKSQLCYKSTVQYKAFYIHKDLPVTVEATRTLLLLDTNLMRPRISDPRIGIFWNYRTKFSTKNVGAEYLFYTNRWRVEPKDMEAYKKGELVEPKKPIVFYLDSTFPEDWKPSIREAVLSWNKTFEKIGLKNVLQVKDFPTLQEDPDFDPDNLKYSCIRYAPIPVQNAMGPSWIDPRTGEIINASVFVYHDVVRLINNWRFVQTAAVDADVRNKILPKPIFDESLNYIIRHEIGHTLGFMHNMSASASVPTDSLRSASFTRKHGTTPCIMDYARFNYVAQPGDKEKGVMLTPPEFGEYDYFLVKWLYESLPDAESPEDEIPVLRALLSEKSSNPIYKYGKQQIYQNLDPSAQTEDLGDDPVKSTQYGLKNLKYIMANFDQWLNGKDLDYSYREEVYYSMLTQYLLYMGHLGQNIGGVYSREKFEGDDCKAFESVSRQRQERALGLILKELNDVKWLEPEVSKNFSLTTALPKDIQKMIVSSLFEQFSRVYLSSIKSKDPFTVKDYMGKLYAAGWSCAAQGRMPNDFEQLIQEQFVKACFDKTGLKPTEEKYGRRGVNLQLPQSLTEYQNKKSMGIDVFEDTGFVRERHVNPFAGMGFEQNIEGELKPYLKNIFYDYLIKVQAVVKSNYDHSSHDTKMYYRMLLKRINDVVKN